MIRGNQGQASTLRELSRFAKAIEKRGNKQFTQSELAAELGISQSSTARYLAFFIDHLGLQLETAARAGSSVKGKWKFLDAIRRYYQNL